MHSRNTGTGLFLFFIYLVYYGWFVLKNAFAPQSMEATSFFGVNAAVVHGFGLIVAAFVLAVIYEILCKPEETIKDEQPQEEGDAK